MKKNRFNRLYENEWWDDVPYFGGFISYKDLSEGDPIFDGNGRRLGTVIKKIKSLSEIPDNQLEKTLAVYRNRMSSLDFRAELDLERKNNSLVFLKLERKYQGPKRLYAVGTYADDDRGINNDGYLFSTDWTESQIEVPTVRDDYIYKGLHTHWSHSAPVGNDDETYRYLKRKNNNLYGNRDNAKEIENVSIDDQLYSRDDELLGFVTRVNLDKGTVTYKTIDDYDKTSTINYDPNTGAYCEDSSYIDSYYVARSKAKPFDEVEEGDRVFDKHGLYAGTAKSTGYSKDDGTPYIEYYKDGTEREYYEDYDTKHGYFCIYE